MSVAQQQTEVQSPALYFDLLLMCSALTSKQYSCPRMLEWTGLMMASSSRVRSSASAALLGDSKDSWEWDSLKLCIKRALGGVTAVVRRGREGTGGGGTPFTQGDVITL